MSNRISWNQYFMGLAFTIAQRSEDSSTKHGCVLVTKKNNLIIGVGYNGVIAGLDSSKVDIINRPSKYKFFLHSEKNALLNCTILPRFVDGGVKAYITGHPCLACTQDLIQAGVDEFFLAARRGFTNHSQEEKDDFDLITREKKIKVEWVPLEKVQWLNKIDLN
jgi:dCMP deaminase